MKKRTALNKTLYVKPEDNEVWKKGMLMIPFYRGMSVSEFCTEQIRKMVAELEKKHGSLTDKKRPKN